MASRDKTKIKEAVIPRLISGVSKVFEQTLLEELGDSPCSSTSITRLADRPRNLLTLNRGVFWPLYYVVYRSLMHGLILSNSDTRCSLSVVWF